MFCSECGKEIVNDAKVCSYCGKPVRSGSQTVGGMQSYNYSGQNIRLKPDDKFNLAAGLFTWIWALVKGMWDLFLADTLICFVCGLLAPVGIGVVLLLIYLIARIVFVGRNANYYCRLKKTQKIPMHKAIRDTNLRRI